ncbi:hypothetical protein NZD88_05060 [Chryseobacterium antibioticum]|uniref:Tetratricopeptide repeat protein n=1 Tax=Chryseobacterium pyrolae TaxID=2987481 RepID=A0ABT2IE72_9FLAO|nr:hypothetical protein [Chryseobacterium pyrolae]MCT2406921.1 hypothetical protein [Chryseobacterium pyrolae]
MKGTFKIFIGIIVFIAAGSLLYVIGKDALRGNDAIFKDGVTYYNNKQFEAAEQSLQSEADRGNKKAYPYLGHTKLILNKPEEAEKYLLLTLEDLKDNSNVPVKQNVLFNLGSTYLNLKEDNKAKTYLQEAAKLGNQEAEELLIKYNLN